MFAWVRGSAAFDKAIGADRAISDNDSIIRIERHLTAWWRCGIVFAHRSRSSGLEPRLVKA